MRFSTELLQRAAAVARERHLSDGERLVGEGDESGDDVYLIAEGVLVATIRTAHGEVVVGTIAAGEIVGEVTVIAGGRRTATLTADGPATVHAFDRSEFEAWLHDDPELADAVSEQARDRIDRTQVAAIVTELLGVHDPRLVGEIVERVEWRRLEAGQVLFEQGDVSDAAYFVVGGRLLVWRHDPDGGEVPVAELGRGSVVGELGLLDDAPRSASVRAVRDTTLATLSGAAFEELVLESPRLMLHVTRSVISRLRSDPIRSHRASALAIVVTAEVDPDQSLDVITDEISRFGSVRLLSSSLVDEVLHRREIAQSPVDDVGVPRLVELMHEADVSSDHLVLLADEGPTQWTCRALRHADRVLIFMSAEPAAAELERIDALLALMPAKGHARRMLALVRPADGAGPAATARIIDRLGAHEVSHLRSGSVVDLQRVARLATGHGVGVVLSGGGARGFAHLGAVRALRESGVPVDAVGGCSMGAPMAGGVALGLPDDELIDLAAREFRHLLDYTVPVVALLKGGRITRSIETNFGQHDIEDLLLPFYCVSTNLTTSQLKVHRRGSAALAIRASVAIPGVLPPVPAEGDLLVDGGVLNNLPTKVMSDDSRIGSVIAIDVAPRRGPRASSDFGLSVSGLRVLRSRFRRSAVRYPSMSTVLLRSMMTGSVNDQQRGLDESTIDLMLRLNLSGIGLLEFGRAREVARLGYDDSVAQVREWAATQPWIRVVA